jgi:hypothetical protein
MPCAKGSFRENAVSPNIPTFCVRCARGWTTQTVASDQSADCNRLLPGFFGVEPDGVTAATHCPRGSYYEGGAPTASCTGCAGYTTLAPVTDTDGGLVGAKSKSECVAPPGYFNSNGNLTMCYTGFYAAGWGRRESCTSCGVNIPSAQNSPNEHPDTFTANADGLVRASSIDCCKSYNTYIPSLLFAEPCQLVAAS